MLDVCNWIWGWHGCIIIWLKKSIRWPSNQFKDHIQNTKYDGTNEHKSSEIVWF